MKCKHHGCMVNSRSLGYCQKHYTRFHKYGNSGVVNRTGTTANPMSYKKKGDYYEVSLSNTDKVTMVSACDKELLKLRWHLDSDGYASTKTAGKLYRMHRLILKGKHEGMVCDHINRVRLDNRRENLRLVTRRQNSLNRVNPKYADRPTGVRWHKNAKKYIANIRVEGRLIHLGYFDDIEEARKVRAQNTPSDYIMCNSAPPLKHQGEKS